MTAIIATALVATTLVRRLMARRVSTVSALPADTTDRIARIENAVDTIALEAERISEGQRFVTRLMGESRQLGVGVETPDGVRQG